MPVGTSNDGDFTIAAEQSGIFADKGGNDLAFGGATELKGRVIASEADASRNSLTEGALTARDIVNRDRYSASSTSISGVIGTNLSGRDGTDLYTDGNGRVGITHFGLLVLEANGACARPARRCGWARRPDNGQLRAIPCRLGVSHR